MWDRVILCYMIKIDLQVFAFIYNYYKILDFFFLSPKKMSSFQLAVLVKYLGLLLVFK